MEAGGEGIGAGVGSAGGCLGAGDSASVVRFGLVRLLMVFKVAIRKTA